ncbi:FG-GAP-like repeat-containing protein [Flavobacterium sp. RSB2_4_14]|uniref:FG-GAP-like repeat-containing protein n=1 Tax=Flavobacterium sp. RSB2_4_14 TaxID=3447665 RepID=UPI003F4019DF
MKKITLLFVLLFLTQITKAQDTCASAQPITAGTYVVTVIDGTQVPNPVCAANGATPATRPPAGEWYSYTPTQNYTVTVTSDLQINNGKDTRFHVYTGGCGALTCYSGDDDGGAIGTGYLSVASFDVTAGTNYIIAWDNRWSSTGFTFQLIEAPIVVPPPTPISYTLQTINTINSTFNLCVVDMNGDKKDDIVGVSANNLRVHNQGTAGTFSVTDFPISGTSDMPNWSLAAGDYNKDGFNDILLGSGSGLTFWRSNSTGTAYTNVNPSDYIFCQRTNFIDINNDGNLDAFSCHDVAPNVYYLNDGLGNMTYYQSGTPGAYNLGVTASGGNYASLWTDFDNDGDRDMFISKCSGPPCELHRNDGNGVFTDISAAAGINVTPIQTWSSAIADFDNDGDMDIIITASAGTHKFFRNNLDTATVAFTNITAGSGWDTNTSTNIDNIAYDFDNDGRVDVLGGGNKIMFNQGNNVFAPVSYSGISVGAVGDLNNDGFLDILNGNTIRYAVPNGNNWIKMTFQGIQSNSNGIGARVEIYGPWGKQIRDVRSGEGFKYMSSLNVHFGLGTATTITQVIVRWPSGVVDTFNNVTPNQTFSVVEGSTLGINSFESSVFTMYPNPVKNNITIAINTANPVEFTTAEIYDLTGRRVQVTTVINQNVGVDALATGTYILKLTDTNNKNYSQKFIKE